MNNNCPHQNNLAAFLTGESSAAERNEIELHLAECADCRRNLAMTFSHSAEEYETFAAPDFLKEKVKILPEKKAQGQTNKMSAPGFSFFSSKRNFWQLAFAASLLVCLGLAGFYVLRFQPPTATDTLRQGSRTSNSLTLLSPTDGANLSSESLEFHWTRVPNAKSYTLFVLDEKGDIIAQQTTTQESFSSNTLTLTQGKHYFWFVRAKLADGTALDSDTAKFLFVK